MAGESGETAFAKGSAEYARGEFGEAIEQYENAVRSHEWSGPLFYNLGNAFFRVGDFGNSILSYERALQLSPHLPEAEANLRLAREQSRALELRPGGIERYAGFASVDVYAVVAAFTFWIAASCGAINSFHQRRRKGLVVLIAVAILVFAAASYAVRLLETGSKGGALAIITAKNAEARSATADNASTVLPLPPGSEIEVVSRRGDWIYATLPNDFRGWVPASAAEFVRL
ncbi:MAG: tetratricopeptide repeat protein [Chthoniobacterales bacterium]